MNFRHAISEIQTHGRNKAWWRKRFMTHVLSPYFTGPGKPETDPVMELDWDNLIILDACRYDLFEEVYQKDPLPGKLEHRTSVQSGTPGFLTENFGEGDFHDIVYVSGNPYVDTELPGETFHAVKSVWKDGWDEERQTVLPETMAQRTIEIAEEYPNKRIISHFLQPHTPFIGDVSLGDRDTFAIREKALGDEEAKTHHRTPFELLDVGEVSYDDVWEAYRSNLERAWPSVQKVLDELPGLSAVTSDHGNAMGERAWPFPIRVYGHPLGILIPALTDVPWLTHKNGDRKVIREETPEPSDQAVDAATNERLRLLGYTE